MYGDSGGGGTVNAELLEAPQPWHGGTLHELAGEVLGRGEKGYGADLETVVAAGGCGDGWHQGALSGFLSLVTVETGCLLQPHSDGGVQGGGGGGQALLKQHQKKFGAVGVCVPEL